MISSSKKNSNQLEKSQKFCSQIVLRCLYLAPIGRPDILWSVSKLARSVTKWTQACDKRLARLISHITQTNSDNLVMWKHSTALQMGLVSRLRLCRQSSGLNINVRRCLVYFRRRTFVPVSWMCKKQTAVSHISTESEIISLDAACS